MKIKISIEPKDQIKNLRDHALFMSELADMNHALWFVLSCVTDKTIRQLPQDVETINDYAQMGMAVNDALVSAIGELPFLPEKQPDAQLLNQN